MTCEEGDASAPERKAALGAFLQGNVTKSHHTFCAFFTFSGTFRTFMTGKLVQRALMSTMRAARPLRVIKFGGSSVGSAEGFIGSGKVCASTNQSETSLLARTSLNSEQLTFVVVNVGKDFIDFNNLWF
jgi:hypothetical protein